jgi:glutathione synthase/RimK-type ligase-like ATP-grasp enzyme
VIAALTRAGIDVECYSVPQDLLQPGTAESFDAGWVRYAPHAATVGRTPMYWQAAISLEAAGVPMLNTIRSHEIVGNKLLMDIEFQRANIKHPRSQLVAHCSEGEFEGPFICKPIGGARAEGVVIVDSLHEARAHEAAIELVCIAQEFITAAACVRVVATPERAVRIYEKRVSADQPIASVAHGADRVLLDDPGGEMEAMATACVRAADGGLMGVDLLRTSEGELWALEVNASFAFDASDELICQAFVDELKAAAARR